MNPKQYYQTYLKSDKAKLESVVSQAGTTIENFQQIAIANGAVSSRLAKSLADASNGEMSELEILYPDRPT